MQPGCWEIASRSRRSLPKGGGYGGAPAARPRVLVPRRRHAPRPREEVRWVTELPLHNKATFFSFFFFFLNNYFQGRKPRESSLCRGVFPPRVCVCGFQKGEEEKAPSSSAVSVPARACSSHPRCPRTERLNEPIVTPGQGPLVDFQLSMMEGLVGWREMELAGGGANTIKSFCIGWVFVCF